MLEYNFDWMFRARGISKPFAYLKREGFSDNFASRIKNNKVSRLEPKHLERLCVLLRCTPNDLMQWTPNPDQSYEDEHPMYALKKPNEEIDLTKTLSSIPLNQLKEIDEMIKEKLKNKSQVHEPISKNLSKDT